MVQFLNFVDKKQYVLWGAGEVCKNFLRSMKGFDFVAIIDSDKNLWGTQFEGIDIINLDTYKEKYSNIFIIVTPITCYQIINTLEYNNIKKYFILSDCPMECASNYKIEFPNFFSVQEITKNTKVAIYGLTLFSMAVYRFLESKGCSNISIVEPPNGFTETQKYIIKEFDLLNNIIKSVQISLQEVIYYTIRSENELLALESYTKNMIINVYDQSTYNEKKHNKRIADYENIHTGKRCFIVATGPSLKTSDLDILWENNEFVFSMNNIFPALNRTKWKPNYYIIADKISIAENTQKIIDLEFSKKFVADTVDLFWEQNTDNEINKFHLCVEYCRTELPRFSFDLIKRLYDGWTITYICLQFAVYMGFKEIYLLGVDFNYPKDADVHTLHFTNEYYNQTSEIVKTGNKANVKGMHLAYKKAKEVADELGIKIYNATRGGCLEVFERVDFDSLF